MRYELIVLGNNRSGWLGALEAAKLHKRVALIECSHDRTSTTNSFREAALLLSGLRHCDVSPHLFARRRRLAMDQLRQVSHEVAIHEAASFATQFREHGIDHFAGQASFVGPNEVEVITPANEPLRLNGDNILLAVGTRPLRPHWVPFDGETIFDAGELLKLDHIPRSMIVVGAGIDSLEFASLFAVLGTRVAVVDARPRLLEFWDREVVALFRQQAETCGVRFRFGRSVQAIEKTPDHRAVVRLQGGQNLLAECVLYASGGCGNTNSLKLSVAGLLPDEQGRLWCNEHGQTWIKHIYGVGEVVGFPALGRAALQQSRRAVHHAFRVSGNYDQPTAYGLFTIPELAMVGATEEQLATDLVAYEAGIARFADTARDHIGGVLRGTLKLLFHRESLELLGVHCLSGSATELIQIGQTAMSSGRTIESFRETTFGDSPLSECYRQAAENGFARLANESDATARLSRFERGSMKSAAKHRRLVPSRR